MFKGSVFGICSFHLKNKKKSIKPLGSAFALSPNYLFTACHNIDTTLPFEKYVLIREFDNNSVCEDALIPVEIENYSVLEDWCIFRLPSGADLFTEYIEICPEDQLPEKGVKIGIVDFPIGLKNASTHVEVDIHYGQLHQYESKETIINNSDELAVVPRSKKVKLDVDIVSVKGARVLGSCGGPYMFSNDKAIAFHFETTGDDLLHTSSSLVVYSHGYLFCKLSKFMKWYTINVVKP